jgi:hypothetical protein
VLIGIGFYPGFVTDIGKCMNSVCGDGYITHLQQRVICLVDALTFEQAGCPVTVAM